MSAKTHAQLRILAWLTAGLGVISLFLLMADYLALTDIWRSREPDLQGEWLVVALSFVPIIFFHLCVFITLFFVFKSTKQAKPPVNRKPADE